MSCSSQTFSLTPEQFQQAATKLQNEHDIHVNVSDPNGIISQHGVEAEWKYLAPFLTVTVTKKPFIISCDTVSKGIQEFFTI